MKRKCIVKPGDLLKGHPDLTRPPPFLHLDPYMRIVYDDKYIHNRICFQIYTFGEYGVHTKQLWQWKGSCICGVCYGDPSPVVVKTKMNQHIQAAAHEPGLYYALPGRDRWLEAARQKQRSKT